MIQTVADALSFLVIRDMPIAKVGNRYLLDGQALSGKELLALARRLDDESGDKPSKYNAVRTTVGEVTFASKAEARRYAELRKMEQTGAISDLELQPRYELQPAFRDGDGVRHRPIFYVADFQYWEKGRIVSEDVKGMATDVYLLKIKIAKHAYPHIRFREVKA
jgi:hypothetical protein